MPDKKTYTVSYDNKFEMTVEIDHAVMTDEKLHEINDFWGDAHYRFINADRDITKAVLKLLAAHAFRLTLTSFNAIDAFNDNRQEGWPAMDGSEGITIVRIDDVCFDADDIEVLEAKGS
jgi:hypothetical protein